MAQVKIHDDTIAVDSPMLVEGLPGVGLVGKIATDLLIEQFDMTYFASIHCDGLPQIGIYHDDDTALKPPVRLYADVDRDLLALQSEVPISGAGAPEFASCVTAWLERESVTPIYLSGRPSQKDGDVPELFGVASGDGGELLRPTAISRPDETGAVSGPTGALLNRAVEVGLDGVGLVVESDPRFPDPEAAQVLVREGIEPITGIEVDTDRLVEQAETIREQRQQLAERIQEAQTDENTQARPIGMYQ